jgi:hypothetical protein
VGYIFCLLALMIVSLFVEETLDSGQRRSARFICADVVAWLRGFYLNVTTCFLPSHDVSITPRCQRKGGYQKIDSDENVNDDSNHATSENNHGNDNDVWHENDEKRPGCMEISDRNGDDEGDEEEDALKEAALKYTYSSSMLWISPVRLLQKSISKRCSNINALRRWSNGSSTTSAVVSTTEMTNPPTTTLATLWSKRSPETTCWCPGSIALFRFKLMKLFRCFAFLKLEV